ncbi:MAG: glutathione S-transferase family protein [Acidimicrobiales bacterium]
MSPTDTTARSGARFERQAAAIRDWVTADGSSGFEAEPGRYHLYVSLACPWAHRAMIVRKLKGLEDVVSLSVVDPIRDERSWAFRDVPGAEPDPVNGFSFLREAYEATVPGWDAHVSVPVLWDRERGRIVNQESADIVVMLNEAFDDWATPGVDLYPEALRAEIDELNGWVYETVNNGVYEAGFSSDQHAHEEAVTALFVSLDRLEERLTDRRYLFGDHTTLADWRLFTTLLRFDPVYHGHFKCNIRRIVDYPALWGYLRDLLSIPGISETVNMDHIKRHYYMTHPQINPTRVVSVGPALDYGRPHGREALMS